MSRPLVGRQLSPFPTSDSSDIVLDESHLVDVKSAIVLLVDLFKVNRVYIGFHSFFCLFGFYIYEEKTLRFSDLFGLNEIVLLSSGSITIIKEVISGSILKYIDNLAKECVVLDHFIVDLL